MEHPQPDPSRSGTGKPRSPASVSLLDFLTTVTAFLPETHLPGLKRSPSLLSLCQTLQRGELLFNSKGATFRAESVSEARHQYVELFNLEFEELHTFFVGNSGGASALVHNGQDNYIKKAAVPTEADHIRGVRSSGKYDAVVGSEAEARRIAQQALPHATELPPGVVGVPYPSPPAGVKAWFQVQPAEPNVGNMLPHIKYADWTGGKKGSGGTWGHLFFPPS